MNLYDPSLTDKELNESTLNKLNKIKIINYFSN